MDIQAPQSQPFYSRSAMAQHAGNRMILQQPVERFPSRQRAQNLIECIVERFDCHRVDAEVNQAFRFAVRRNGALRELKDVGSAPDAAHEEPDPFGLGEGLCYGADRDVQLLGQLPVRREAFATS